ncbi:MAG: hypothetical protein JSW73_00285 [Candidatus Woesearchaeota archaeon]|nr:MAG: hypothetical protein JSW73_00285 [Candidatus Woesearchaeota archaeon]
MVVKIVKLITPIIEAGEKLAGVQFGAKRMVVEHLEKSFNETITNLKKTIKESEDKYYSDLEKTKKLIDKLDSTSIKEFPELINELKENNIIDLVDVVDFAKQIQDIQIQKPEISVVTPEEKIEEASEIIVDHKPKLSSLEEKVEGSISDFSDTKPTELPSYESLLNEALPGCKVNHTTIKRTISNVITNENNSFHKELGDYLNKSTDALMYRYIKTCGSFCLLNIGIINEDIMKSVVGNYATDLDSVGKVIPHIMKKKESGKRIRIENIQKLINCDVNTAHQTILASMEIGITQYLNKVPDLDSKIEQDKTIGLSYNDLFKQAMPNYSVPFKKMSTLISKAIADNNKTLQELIDKTDKPNSRPVYHNIIKNCGNFCLKTLYEKGAKPDKKVIESVRNKYNIAIPDHLNISLDYINNKQSGGEKIKAHSMRKELNKTYDPSLSLDNINNLQLACAEIGLRSVNLKNSK